LVAVGQFSDLPVSGCVGFRCVFALPRKSGALTFVLALPFLITAHTLNGLTPAPTPGDMQAKVEKWDLIEAFPLTWSLFRFHFSDFPPVG
jgi:hypothetical protein